MTRLIDRATVLRSKNAGPLFVTFDIMFADEATFRGILRSGVVSAEKIADLYRVRPEDVAITAYEIVNSIKVTIPRPQVSGDLEDTDVYGCQQQTALANIPVP